MDEKEISAKLMCYSYFVDIVLCNVVVGDWKQVLSECNCCSKPNSVKEVKLYNSLWLGLIEICNETPENTCAQTLYHIR